MAMRQSIQSGYPQPDLRQDIRHPRGNAAWWWLFHQILVGDATLPLLSSAELKWSISTTTPDVDQVWMREPELAMRMRHGTLRLLQYNVLSMGRLGSIYDQKDGINTHATYIKCQLESADIHIAGFQECRTRASATINSSAWSRITSEARNGHGGCELWLRRSFTLDGHGDNDLDTAHCITIFASPELLVVRTAICGSPILCVVGHAPHTGASQEKMENWWRVLHEQMQPFKDIPTISFLDANAHFDGPHLPYVGGHQSEAKRNKAADLMLQFLRLTETAAINTFPTHRGEAATWHHPAHHTQHRTDYICIPLEWMSNDSVRSEVGDIIDVGLNAVDHQPLFGEIDLTVQARRSANRLPQRIDIPRILQASPDKLQSFYESLDTPEWDTNVHIHGAQIMRNVRTQMGTHFGAMRKPPSKTYITEETWQLRCMRIDLKRAMTSVKHSIPWGLLATVFETWRQRTRGEEITFNFAGYCQFRQKCLLQLRDYGIQLHQAKQSLQKQLKRDKLAYLERVAEDAQFLPGHEIFRRLRAAGVGGRSRRSSIQPLNMVIFDGKTPTTPEEYKAGWQRHFEKLEDGSEVTEAQLLSEVWERQLARDTQARIENIPTLMELERSFRISKAGKAHFYDGIPAEITKVAAPLAARHFYTLFMKQCGMLTEAVTLKGGILVHAYKGKGDMTNPLHHRALMISSTVGKAFHRTLRADFSNAFRGMALPLQIAGLPTKGVQQAAHAITCFGAWMRRECCNHAILFIDIAQAYYRVARQSIVKTSDFDEAAARLFAELGLPADTFPAFARELAKSGAFHDRDDLAFEAQMADEIMNGTWFSVRDSNVKSQTRRGSRPGDNLADMLFNFAFKQLIGAAQQELEAEDLVLHIPWNGHKGLDGGPKPAAAHSSIAMMGPIWADDAAFMAADKDPHRLLRKLRAMAKIVTNRLARAGMEVNFQPGKTEIVLDLRGPQARALRADLMRHSQPGLWVDGIDVFIRIVPRYIHLGTLYTATGSMQPELRRRLEMAHVKLNSLSTPIFKRRGLGLQRKLCLFQSLILSGLWHNAAIWPPLTTAEKELLKKGVFRLYRRVLQMHYKNALLHMTTADVYTLIKLPDAEICHAVERLRYLRQLLASGEDAMWALLAQEQRWLLLVQQDLQWLHAQGQTNDMPTPCSDSYDEWCAFIGRAGKRWTALLRRAREHASLQCSKQLEWDAWQHKVIDIFDHLRGNIASSEHRGPSLAACDLDHACMLCRQTFSSKAAWALHAFKRHGRKHRARWFATGTQCESCHREYHSNVRLARHLRTSHACRRHLEHAAFSYQTEPGVGSRSHRQFLDAQHQRPVLPVQGPQQEMGAAEPYSRMDHLDPFEQTFCDLLLNATETPWTGQPQLVERLRQELCGMTMHPQEATGFMLEWARDISAFRLHERHDDIQEAISTVVRQLNALWLFPDHPWWQSEVLPQGQLTVLERLENMGECIQQCWQHIPLHIITKQIVVLHLFSGRRRDGDMQAQVGQRSLAPSSYSFGLSRWVRYMGDWQGHRVRQ